MRRRSHPTVLCLALLSSAALTACGGGGGGSETASGSALPAPAAAPITVQSPAPADPTPVPLTPAVPAPVAVVTAPTAPVPSSVSPAPAPAPVTSPVVSAPPAVASTTTGPAAPPTTLNPVVQAPLGGVITDVTFVNTSTTAQAAVPQTFGQVFAPGHVPNGQTIIGQLSDGSAVALQADIKARHADGSVRHAIISLKVPQIAASGSTTIRLFPAAVGSATLPVTPQRLLDDGFSTSVNLDIAGVRYSASPENMMRSGQYKTWLSGAVTNEWMVNVPLATAQGTVHPHLVARFAIRAVNGAPRARVDVTIENNWAYEAAPQNVTYDAQILVGGQTVFTKLAVPHYHHARWRKMFWWGGEPQVHIKHNVGYLIGTRAVPNFDRTINFTETQLARWQTLWNGTRIEPMGVGIVNPYMRTTGGRDELGQMPAWYATYLLTMDKRLKEVTLGSGDLAGSWSIHYRDRVTDRPISLAHYPYMSSGINKLDTLNPVTKKFEAFPPCATTTSCTSPYSQDTAHQAAFAFVPYMVTGDYYYLEELQFWASYNAMSYTPGYREYAKGLVKADQVRGQAWSLRTLAEVSYISPDDDSLKAQFTAQVKHNIDWYSATYANNPSANALGMMTHGHAMTYNDNTSMAPWMDDFMTASFGRMVDLGFSDALPMLKWKSKFSFNRMTAPGTCWISGAIYSLKVRDSATSPVYTTMAQAFKASHTAEFAALACGGTEMAAALKLRVGEMTGYSAIHTGYPSNMQPALAYASEALGDKSAWNVFMQRSIKPNYGKGPQFAIVPR